MTNQKLDTLLYLDRLGITGDICPDEQTLVQLTRAHLEMIPFENLEVRYEHREPSLEPEDLFNKIVLGKRGGYCFELNKIFYLLLQALGYECYPIPARVVHRREELRPVSHRATVVVIDGRKWFIDVGFGGAGPKGAIRMDTRDVQNIFGDDFTVEPDTQVYHGEYVLSRIDDGISERVLVFRDMPWLEPDFVTLSSYYATYPRSPFKIKRVLYRCVPGGWYSLTENTFTTLLNGNRQTVELQTEAQVQDVIGQYFGLFVTPRD